MIACPVCGSETHVRETRTVQQYVRRRRFCSKRSCNKRVTTYEIVVADDDGMTRMFGDVVLIPQRDLEAALRALTGALATRLGSQSVVDLITGLLPTTEKGTTDGDEGKERAGTDAGNDQRRADG